MKNNKEPRMDSWGAPALIVFHAETCHWGLRIVLFPLKSSPKGWVYFPIFHFELACKWYHHYTPYIKCFWYIKEEASPIFSSFFPELEEIWRPASATFKIPKISLWIVKNLEVEPNTNTKKSQCGWLYL